METALITGASSGIGRELAILLAASGRKVVLVARRRALLEELRIQIEGAGGQAVVIESDLAAPRAVDGLLDALRVCELEVDILVNNAGFGGVGRFAELIWERQHEMLHLNITVLCELTYRLLPAMLRRKTGQVVNVGSVAGFLPGPYQAVYYASKACVNSFSVALAEELRGTGVRVTTLCPGPTVSGFQETAGFKAGRNDMSSLEVAQEAMAAIDGAAGLVVAGRKNRVLVALLGLIPMRIKARLAGRMGHRRVKR